MFVLERERVRERDRDRERERERFYFSKKEAKQCMYVCMYVFIKISLV